MKKLITYFCLAILLVAVAYGGMRDRLYRHFGPRLIEAVCLVVKDEINVLRAQHGLSERTNQQIMGAVSNKLETLTLYNWQTEEP